MGSGASTGPRQTSSESKYELSQVPEPPDVENAKKQILDMLGRVAKLSARYGGLLQVDEGFVGQCGSTFNTLPLYILSQARLPVESQLEHFFERLTKRTPHQQGGTPAAGASSPGSRNGSGRLDIPCSPRLPSKKSVRHRRSQRKRSQYEAKDAVVTGTQPQSRNRPFRKLGSISPIGSPGSPGSPGGDSDSSSEWSEDSGASKSSAALGDIVRRTATRNVQAPVDVKMGKRSTGSLEDLLRSAAEIASSSLSNLRDLCVEVSRHACWLLNAERCTIFVKDPSAERLFAYVDPSSNSTSEIKSTLIDVKVKEIDIQLLPPHSQEDMELEQQVYTTGEPFHLCQLSEPEVIGRVNHLEKGVEISEALYQPIRADRQVYGVCKIAGRRDTDEVEFTEDDENLLSTLLIFVGVCFKNAILYKDLNAAYAQTEVLLELTKALSSCSLDIKPLCNTIIQAAKKLLNSDRCALFLVDRNAQELVAQFEGSDKEVRLPMNKGIAGHVATTGKTCNIRDAYADSRFNKDMDRQTGYKTDTILCAPIRYEGQIVAVAQLVNKRSGYFTLQDEETFDTFGIFSGINIRNCMVHNEMLQEKDLVQAVLQIVTQLQEVDITQIGPIMNQIMTGAKKLANCDRCALFLVDKERNQLVSKIASGQGEGEDVAIRVKIGEGIAGTVAQVGENMNVKDAYSEPKFNKETDRATGYVTKTILAMPVKYGGEVIAVTQLINKHNDVFNRADEARLHVFTQFAGMCLRNAQLIEFMRQTEAEQRRLHEAQLAGEMRSGAGQNQKVKNVKDADVYRIMELQLSKQEDESIMTPNFNIHNYNISSPEHERLQRLVLELYDRLGLVERFNLPKDKIVRLAIVASSSYRHVPYHNFTHAFDVAQTLCTFLLALKPWDRYLTELEVLGLLTAAVFHDIDHMGLNNSFQLKAETPLGVLSSSSGSRSVLEVHHCNLAIEIMSDPSCNIFCNLSKEESRDVWKTIIDAILATDMARHAELSADFQKLALGYNVSDISQRRQLVAMLLKAADISNITRPFDISRVWAQYVTAEFYYQGDAERHMGLDVTPMFDRQNKTELATGQIGFMKFMGIPYFTIVSTVTKELSWALKQLQENLATWEQQVEQRKGLSRKSVQAE